MAVHRSSFWAAVLLLASLDLWCSSSSPPCPKSCTCQRAPVLNCSSAGLSSVPQLIQDSITELDLSHNLLSSVTFHQPYPNLRNLWLGNNSIPHLSLCIEKTVKGQHLGLRSAARSGSRCQTWAPTLQLLSVERNLVEQLPEGLDAVESLQVLQLSFNRISSLELGVLSDLYQLRELHLQHNLITHLDPKMFQNLDKLRILDLRFNMLTNMQQLTYLTLRNIEADVKLGGNRWCCDCNMRSIRRQMAYDGTRGLQTWNIVCAVPSTFSGKDLLQLDEEDLKCLSPENNLNLHRDVTIYSGAEILLSCSAKESEWWTPSGRASVSQNEAGLHISDFSEGDTGLYVCVSEEDHVLSVFNLQISKMGSARQARSLPRVHSQISLQEPKNGTVRETTQGLTQSDLALAVCLSIFFTFLLAFILGVLARPCINRLLRRFTKKKGSPATHTVTSVQQRHYDNQAFSNAEEPEEMEPHRERRVTFSRIELTEESNMQYYDTVVRGDQESIRSDEVFEYQEAEVDFHRRPKEKQSDDNSSADLAVERLRNMKFEHIPDPDELEERRSLSSSSDSSQNLSELDQKTRKHNMSKSLQLVEDSFQKRADLSIATKTEIPQISMKDKSEFPGSSSVHTNKAYPIDSDVSQDEEELFEFSDGAQSPSAKTNSLRQVKNGYDTKSPGEAPEYSSSSSSDSSDSDKKPMQTKIKQKTEKKQKTVGPISKPATYSSSSNSESEEKITYVDGKGRINTEQLPFQESKRKTYVSDGRWPTVDLQYIPRLKRRLDIKTLLPSSDSSSSSESEDEQRGHVTENTQDELMMARHPTNVSQTLSPKTENHRPGFELGKTKAVKRPLDIQVATARSDSSSSSESEDQTRGNVIKQRNENLLMSKLQTKVSPTVSPKTETDSDSSSSSDSDNERKYHMTQKKHEELHISKLPTDVTTVTQKPPNQWPTLDFGRVRRIKRRLDIKAPTADSDSLSSSDSEDETRGQVMKQKQEGLPMSRLPGKVSPTVHPNPENRWPPPDLGKTTELKRPLDIKPPSTDSDSSSSSDSGDDRKDHMTKQKQEDLHISQFPTKVTQTVTQKAPNQWPALDLGRITRIKRRLDIKAPTADSDSLSSSDSEDETRGQVIKQKQEELLMSRLPGKVSPTVHPKPENRWPPTDLGKTTQIKKPLDIKPPSTDSDSSSSSDSDNERKYHMTQKKHKELHISKPPTRVTTVTQKPPNQWPTLDFGRITRIKRRLDIKAPTADSDSLSSSDSEDKKRSQVIQQKQEELLMSRLPGKVSPTVHPNPENRWPALDLGKTTQIKKPLDIKAQSTDSDSSSSSDSDNERKDHKTQKKHEEYHISKPPTNVTTVTQKPPNQWPTLDFGRITRIKRRLDIKAPTADSDSLSSSDSEDETRGQVIKQKQEELLMSRLPGKVSPTVHPNPENRWPALDLGKTTQIKKPLDIKAQSTDSDSSSSSDSDNERKDHMTQKKHKELHISKPPTNVTTVTQKPSNQWPTLDFGRITRIKRRLDIKAPTADSDSLSSSDSEDETRGQVMKQKQEELPMSRLPGEVSPTVHPKPENCWPAPDLGKTTLIKKPLEIKVPSIDSDLSSSSDSDNERKDLMTQQKKEELHISKPPTNVTTVTQKPATNVTTATQKPANKWPTLDFGRISQIKRRLDIKAPTADSDSLSSSDSEDETRGQVMKQKQEELPMSRLPGKVSPTVHPKPENRWPPPDLGKTTELKRPLDIKPPSTDSDSSSSSDSGDDRKDHLTKQKQDDMHISQFPTKVAQTVTQKAPNEWPALDLGKITRIKRHMDITAPTADSDSLSSSDCEDETRGHVMKQKQEEIHISKLPVKVPPTVRPKPENRWSLADLGKTTDIKKPLHTKAPSTDSDSSSSSDSDNDREDNMTKQKQQHLDISSFPTKVTQTVTQKPPNQWPALDFGRITRIKRRLDIKAPTADSDSSSSSDSEDETRGQVMKQKQDQLLTSRLPGKVSPTVHSKLQNRWPAPDLGKITQIRKPADIKAPSTHSDSSSSSDSDNDREDNMTKQKQEDLHISRFPTKVTQTITQKPANQWPTLDFGRITQIKRCLDIKAPTADSDSSSSSDSEDETRDHVMKQEELLISQLPTKVSSTVRSKPENNWSAPNLGKTIKFKKPLDIKAPKADSDSSSSSDSGDETSVTKQTQEGLLMSSLPANVPPTVHPKPENPWSDLGQTTEVKKPLDIKTQSSDSDSSPSSDSDDKRKDNMTKQKHEDLLISKHPVKTSQTVSQKQGNQWPSLDHWRIRQFKSRLDIKVPTADSNSSSSSDSENETSHLTENRKPEKLDVGHLSFQDTTTKSYETDGRWPAMNIQDLPRIKRRLDIKAPSPSSNSSSSSDSEDETRGHVMKQKQEELLISMNAVDVTQTLSSNSESNQWSTLDLGQRPSIQRHLDIKTSIPHESSLNNNESVGITVDPFRKVDRDRNTSRTTLVVDPELQSRWATMNLGVSRFRKHLEITSHATESDLKSPPPPDSPFSSSSESGSGRRQRLKRRVFGTQETTHRDSSPGLENVQVNVSPTPKGPDNKFTFSDIVKQRINKNHSDNKNSTSPSKQSSNSSSSSDSEDETKAHGVTDLSRGAPRIKRHLNIKAPSPKPSNTPPFFSQNENLTKHNAVQNTQASTIVGPTDESLITYKRSIFKSLSLPNSSFTPSGKRQTVDYLSNLSKDGSNDKDMSLASKITKSTSFDDIIKSRLRQSRAKTDGDLLGEIKWAGVGHHLPDLSSSKPGGVDVTSTSLQHASFAELTSPSNDSASGTTAINTLQLRKKSDATLIHKYSSLGPGATSPPSSDILHVLGNSSQKTTETLMVALGGRSERKGLSALKVMSQERRNWEWDKDTDLVFDAQDGRIFSHSQSEKDKVFSQQSQTHSPSASEIKKDMDLLLLYGVPRYKRHSIGDTLTEALLPDVATPQSDD